MDISNLFRFPPVSQCDLRRVEWPHYLNRNQRALLRTLYEAWGEDAIVQIYAGCVRVRSEFGDWRFSNEAELEAGLAMCSRIRQRSEPKQNFME
ncbi:hypothetical protein [Burkholderia pyrrocinia]|uniref:hypothetical protein n=1 Tax=Burkholderia pyrrocinia TaxID=60550 RepID=UPI001BCFDABB|nr:hypothetical protein [Burkholderia pyrrocinia]QVN21300.1 hypothetical protein JYG32_32800 [Burkholderia pyrrocinia]